MDQNRPSPFEFYEIVRCKPSSPDAAIAGQRGAVLGMVQYADGAWGYAIHIYSLGIVYSVDESDLDATGEMDQYESFYSGASVRVRVDPQTGEGVIVDRSGI